MFHGKIGYYDIDTEGGQSGSPVYFTQKDENGSLHCHVVGIHKGVSCSLLKAKLDQQQKSKYNVCSLLTRSAVG